jgi:putative CocE/NonD family hydrolase
MRRLFLITLLAGALPVASLGAQQNRTFVGHWVGSIVIQGQELGFDVDLAQGAGGWTGDISIPAQGAQDLPLAGIVVAGDTITFVIAGIPGEPTFRGALSADGGTVGGTLTQSGQTFTFTMRTGAAAAAQAPRSDFEYLRANYTKREVLIPMRDGVKLFTSIYVPNDTTRPHPIIFQRTPYSVAPYGADKYSPFLGNQLRAYAHEGYIIVRQDVRGRYMSEGEFVNVRPYVVHKQGSTDIDETTDTYDTIDWLLENVPGNNGRVGISGISYGGFYSSMGAIDAHPAVKAVSPQAPVSAWMHGDDFFHNGALLLPHAFDFFAWFGHPRPVPKNTPDRQLDHGTPDGYAYYMRLGALSNANAKVLHDSVAFWNELAAHWHWDAFWAARDVLPHLIALKPAMLWVGGWFDTENLWGALHAYAAAERQSPGATNRLVMGPWSHGQWGWSTADSLGPIAWGSATAEFYTDSIEVPFFNYYLLGDSAPTPKAFEAAVFETGADHRDQPLPAGRRHARLPRAGREGARLRRVRERSRQAGAVYRRDHAVVRPALHAGGPALRRAPAGRPGVPDRAARPRAHDRRPHPGRVLGLHDGHRLRLDREADRRVPRQRRLGPWGPREAGGLSDARAGRRAARQVPQQPGDAGAIRTRRRDPDPLRDERRVPHVRAGPPHHGPGAEYLVPDDRPEPREVHGHLPGEGCGLPQDDAARLPLGGERVASGVAGHEMTEAETQRGRDGGYASLPLSPPSSSTPLLQVPHQMIV